MSEKLKPLERVGRHWAQDFQQRSGEAPRPHLADVRPLLLVAHPDDETIGASAVLGRFPQSFVVYLTDGAPRDPHFWTTKTASQPEYARTRSYEAQQALGLAGVSAEHIFHLGSADQEAIYGIADLVQPFAALLRRLAPTHVISQPYEGGHPDHDCAALLAGIARELLAEDADDPPIFLEMTAYHARDGKCETGEFLLAQNGEAVEDISIELTPEERTRKAEMMACFRSQGPVLQGFAIGNERLREAPRYDFSRPPHAGALWYEMLGWPLTGERWREVAGQAMAQFREALCH